MKWSTGDSGGGLWGPAAGPWDPQGKEAPTKEPGPPSSRTREKKQPHLYLSLSGASGKGSESVPTDVAPPSTRKIPDSVCIKCSINTLKKAS